MQEFFVAHPMVKAALAGAVSGALAAARTDFQAFQSWKSVNDATTYSWGVAAWRWFQGAVVGAVSGAGLAPML